MSRKTHVHEDPQVMKDHAELHFIPESAKAMGLVASVKEIVNSWIDYAENYPVLAEVAHISKDALLVKLFEQSYSDMLRSEFLDFLDDYRLTGKHTPTRAAFYHFFGNAANAYHMVLRNSKTREKYPTLIESMPSLARVMHIASTKQPRALYEKIRQESIARVENKDFSWQNWLAEVGTHLQ